MRILDEDGNEILKPDREKGYCVMEKLLLAHHDAKEYVEEQWHYEVVAEYPNGGQDIERIIDVPGQEACEAWDETEDILRYKLYTDKDYEEMKKEDEEFDRLVKENELLKARISALLKSQEFLEDCIVEMAEVVYA